MEGEKPSGKHAGTAVILLLRPGACPGLARLAQPNFVVMLTLSDSQYFVLFWGALLWVSDSTVPRIVQDTFRLHLHSLMVVANCLAALILSSKHCLR